MDKATNRSQNITITASSGLSDTEVERMRKEAELHADEDKKRKEGIEVHNVADNTAYQAEKMIADYGDKIPAELKSNLEAKAAELKGLLSGTDYDTMKAKTEELNALMQQVGSAMYQQPGAGPEQDPAAGQDGGQTPPTDGGTAGGNDDVVDGEFRSM